MSLINEIKAWVSGKGYQALKTSRIDSSQQTSYGVQESVTNAAYIRSAPVYNLVPANFRTFTSSGGSATVESREYKVSTGTTIYGYAAVQSFRSLNLEYGQTGLCRLSARFPSPTADSWQGCGLISITDEMSFGYQGTTFGVWHRYGGEAEVRSLQVTTQAGGSENATITVNGTGYTVPLTAGTVQKNAKEIADYLNTNATGFYAEQLNDKVIVSASSDGAKSSTWSFSSSTAVATFTQLTAGVTKTSDFVAQADFDGEVPAVFDPTKGNLYSISYGAGYSNIDFRIYDKARDRFLLSHSIDVVSEIERPSINNPSMKCGVYVASVGSTTDISAYCSFIAGFGQGKRVAVRNPRSYRNTKSITSTLTNMFTIRNKRIYNGLINQAEIEPLILTIANEGNKNLLVDIRSNATVAGDTNFQDIGTNLISEIDVAGTTVTEDGVFITSITVAPGDSKLLDLSKLQIRIPPTLKMVISAKQLAGASAASVTATLTWREDV